MEPMSSEPIVSIRDLTFRRGERVIFRDLNLDIPRGQVVAIMGPSGIGKTTLLRLIGGQLRADRGQVCFNGEDIGGMGRSRLFEVRKQMSMLFQSGALFTDMNLFDNVALPLREHTRLPPELLRTLVLMKLESVGLRGARGLMPAELSGGMARRAALARALALDPDLIMYDEPFTGQDPISLGVLAKLIRELNDALGMTSIVVSHDVPEVMAIADYVYVIADAQIIGQGTPEQVRQSASPLVRQFLDGLPDGPVPFHYPAPPIATDLVAGGPHA